MPWKECHIMDERLRFVARRLEGEKMAPLCAAFGISRKTGYKRFDRYKDCGVGAFSDSQPSTAPHLPSMSTVHAVLDRHGLVRRRRRRRHRANRHRAVAQRIPTRSWCADYKGEFMLGRPAYCYPLTITDFASRDFLTCEALSTTQEKFAWTFKDFRLPQV